MLQLSTHVTWKMHSFLANQTPITFSLYIIKTDNCRRCRSHVTLMAGLVFIAWIQKKFCLMSFSGNPELPLPIYIPIFIPNKKETKFFILLIGSTANLYNQLFSMSCSTTHSLIHKATKWHLTHNPWFMSLFKQIKAVSPNLASHIIYVLYLS